MTTKNEADLSPDDAGHVDRASLDLARGEDWWDCLQRLLAERDASGLPYRTKEEIDAEIDETRSGWDDKIDEAYRRIKAARDGEET